MCDCSADDFRAQATGAGARRTLTVDGRCTCPQAGYTLRLEPTPTSADDVVVLALVVERPAFGADMISSTPVHYRTEIGPEARTVVIHHPRGSITIPIESSRA
jgi:hypothetical protein